MKNMMTRFAKDESGATAIEYGLIAALISVVCIAIWRTVGDELFKKYKLVGDELAKTKVK